MLSQALDHFFRSRAALFFGLALAAGLFVGRGVYRTWDNDLRDFAAPYAGTQLFWRGGNPYRHEAIASALIAAGAPHGDHSVAVYPPTLFVALAPFAFWPASAAKILFLLCGLGLMAWGFALWSRWLQLDHRRWFVFALILASAPLHTAMLTMNPALLALGSVMVGSALIAKGDHKTGLPMLGWAMLIKPQIGIVAAGWLLLRGTWRFAAGITLFWTIFLAVIICALWLYAPQSLSTWRANLEYEASTGSISAIGPFAMHRIDPAGLWGALTKTSLSPMVQLALAALFIGAASWRLWNTRQTLLDAWLLAVLAVGSLLAGYHRAYDALLLIPCWMWLAARPLGASIRCLSVGISLVWVLPGGGFWSMFRDHFLRELNSRLTGWWDVVVIPLHNWALLLTATFVWLIHNHAPELRKASQPDPQ